MAEIVYATVEDDAETVPPELRCIWPGCPRRRSPGRAAGSGRQKEYCLKADRPEAGGGPVHNARNRWAWLRNTLTPAHGTGGVQRWPVTRRHRPFWINGRYQVPGTEPATSWSRPVGSIPPSSPRCGPSGSCMSSSATSSGS